MSFGMRIYCEPLGLHFLGRKQYFHFPFGQRVNLTKAEAMRLVNEENFQLWPTFSKPLLPAPAEESQ